MDCQLRWKGTTPEAATVRHDGETWWDLIQMRHDGDLDLISNSRELRNGQILATLHLMKFKMPMSGAPSQSGDIKKWHNLYLDIKEMRCFKAELKCFWQIRGGDERKRGVKDVSKAHGLSNRKATLRWDEEDHWRPRLGGAGEGWIRSAGKEAEKQRTDAFKLWC